MEKGVLTHGYEHEGVLIQKRLPFRNCLMIESFRFVYQLLTASPHCMNFLYLKPWSISRAFLSFESNRGCWVVRPGNCPRSLHMRPQTHVELLLLVYCRLQFIDIAVATFSGLIHWCIFSTPLDYRISLIYICCFYSLKHCTLFQQLTQRTNFSVLSSLSTFH